MKNILCWTKNGAISQSIGLTISNVKLKIIQIEKEMREGTNISSLNVRCERSMSLTSAEMRKVAALASNRQQVMDIELKNWGQPN